MKALIFDLDGTLLNTIADLHTSTNYALKKFEYPERTLEEVTNFVGNGLRMLIKRALPFQADEALISEVLAEMKGHYAEHCHDATAPYAGIPELLKYCTATGIPMAVVSNKADPMVKILCDHFFADHISIAMGDQLSYPRKPAPDMVFAAMQSLGVTEAYYVGDSDVDVQTAHNAGLPCLACAWGFRSKESLIDAGAERIFDSPTSLLQAISSGSLTF